jgi:hypothetical protein
MFKKMGLSFLLICLLLATSPALAINSVATMKMTWKQAAADLPYVKSFIIYAGTQKDQTVSQIYELPYTGQATLTTPIQLTISGEPGTKVKYYFAVAALSKTNTYSDMVFGQTTGGADYLEFTIPYKPSAPFEVIIEILTN